MAEDNGASSWPGLLAEFSKSFLILRDVFGYSLPGGVFLFLGLLFGRYRLSDLSALLDPYHPPAWAGALLLIGCAYSVGHILAAVAYFAYDFSQDNEEQLKKLAKIRADQPGLLIELDRRETMTMFRGTLGMALVAGSLFGICHPEKRALFLCTLIAGVFLLVIFYWKSMPHVGNVREAAVKTSETTSASGELPQKLRDFVEEVFKAAADLVKKP